MRSLKVLGLAGTALAMTLAATPAFAQVGFGVEAGVVRSTVKFDSPTDIVKGRTGLMGGIWFGGNRNGRVGFLGEITYVVKGASDDTSTLKLHYIEIPAVFRINLGSSRNGVSVYPLVGPVFDIKLKAKLDDLDVTDDYNGFDIGLLAGVGVEVTRVAVEVRYNLGLRSIAKDLGSVETIKNRAVQFVVKFRIS